jgi:3-methyladenine DNA glycosylase/8-oxoguanine DNA glycosylase
VQQQQQHNGARAPPPRFLLLLHSQRITLMLNNLCAAHGCPLGDVDGRTFHAFPSLERLCQLKEDDLRSMGFGYR